MCLSSKQRKSICKLSRIDITNQRSMGFVVCRALKKEIEQIEKGELEDKIPELWEQMNA